MAPVDAFGQRLDVLDQFREEVSERIEHSRQRHVEGVGPSVQKMVQASPAAQIVRRTTSSQAQQLADAKLARKLSKEELSEERHRAEEEEIK